MGKGVAPKYELEQKTANKALFFQIDTANNLKGTFLATVKLDSALAL